MVLSAGVMHAAESCQGKIVIESTGRQQNSGRGSVSYTYSAWVKNTTGKTMKFDFSVGGFAGGAALLDDDAEAAWAVSAWGKSGF